MEEGRDHSYVYGSYRVSIGRADHISGHGAVRSGAHQGRCGAQVHLLGRVARDRRTLQKQIREIPGILLLRTQSMTRPSTHTCTQAAGQHVDGMSLVVGSGSLVQHSQQFHAVSVPLRHRVGHSRTRTSQRLRKVI